MRACVRGFAWGGRYFTRSAVHNDRDSQYALGRCYYEGIGVEKPDKVNAISWYRKAAAQNHTEAQRQLGKHYRSGLRDESGGSRGSQDDAESLKWYLMAATGSAGSEAGEEDGGGAEENGGEEDGARSNGSIGKRDPGDAESQFLVAVAYYEGSKSVPKDYKEAVKWFLKAANQDVIGAQLILGNIMAAGQIVPRDENSAAFWYLKAADQGSARAQLKLAQCYISGVGVPRNNVLAAKWFRTYARACVCVRSA